MTGLRIRALFFWLVGMAVWSLPAQASELRVLATTYPMWLIAVNVAGDAPDVSVRLMTPAETGCPHDYALTTRDMRRLAEADVVILNGLGLDDFVLPALAANGGDGTRVIDSSQGVPAHMLEDFGHAHAHSGEAGHADHDADEADPHLFASPARNALLVRYTAAQLGLADPGRSDLYHANAEAYASEILLLADEITALGARLDRRRLLIQHSSLGYLMRDAGLDVAGVLQPHEGQEPSASDMLRLDALIKSEQVSAIVIEPQYPARAGETLAMENDIPLVLLDSGVAGPADAPRDYYLQVTRSNLRVLEQALAR